MKIFKTILLVTTACLTAENAMAKTITFTCPEGKDFIVKSNTKSVGTRQVSGGQNGPASQMGDEWDLELEISPAYVAKLPEGIRGDWLDIYTMTSQDISTSLESSVSAEEVVPNASPVTPSELSCTFKIKSALGHTLVRGGFYVDREGLASTKISPDKKSVTFTYDESGAGPAPAPDLK